MKHLGNTPRIVRPLHTLLLALQLVASVFFSCVVVAQDTSVQAELSSSTIALGESVNLQVVATGIDAELDLSAVEVVADVLGTSSSRQVNIFNGNRESTVIWNVEIRPRQSGQIVVPAVTVGSLTTNPLLLQVEDAPSGAARKVYVEASVDNEQPYVQSQVIYTIKVYQRVQFSDAALDYPNAPGLTVQQIDEGERTNEVVDGQTYSVFQRRYVLFPQTSGRIIIPPVTLQGATPGTRSGTTGLFTPRNRFSRQSNAIELDVKARPASFTGQWWLPVSALELAQNWVTPPEEYFVGRPLTRTITLTADGVGEAQLPEIAPPELPTAKIYSDASEAQTVSVDNGVQATRRFSWAIIPQQAGKLTLPEVVVPWFDVVSGTMKTAMLPAQTIEVQAAAGDAVVASTDSTNNLSDSTSGSATSEGQTAGVANVVDGIITPEALSRGAADAIAASGDATFWKRVSLALGIAWAATALAWIANSVRRGRPDAQTTLVQKTPSPPRIPIQIAAVEAAIKDNDLAALSRSVSAWGRAVYGAGSASPGEIAGRVSSAELKQQLWQLDAALYSPEQLAGTGAFKELPQLLRVEKPDSATVPGTKSQNEYALPAL